MSLPSDNQFKRLLSILFVIAFIYCVIVFVAYLINAFSDISSEFAMFFLGGVGWLIGQVFLKEKEIEQKHIEKKMEAYQKFINEFIDSMTIDKTNPNRPEKLVKATLDLKKAILIWGKPETVKGIIKFQADLNELSRSDPKSTIKTCQIMNSLFKLIRKDLGHNDSQLKELELAQMCLVDNINDIKEKTHDPTN